MKEIFSIACSKRIFITLLVFMVTSCANDMPADSTAQSLQGHWETTGVDPKISITIKENALRYFKSEDFWYETTFTLSDDKNPQRMQTTITNSAVSKDEVGKVVTAIFKFEKGKLVLASGGSASDSPPSFSNAGNYYELTRIEPPQ